MSTDELTTEDQLEQMTISMLCWRRAHDEQLQHTVAERAKTKAAERKAQLLQAKLDGTALTNGTVLGDLCGDALNLLADWLQASELAPNENVWHVEFGKGAELRTATRNLIITPRAPK